MNYKKMYLIIFMLAVISTLFGSTLAYFTWETSTSQRTSIAFTLNEDVLGGTLSAKIVGNANVSSSDAVLKPTECTNSANTIVKAVPITYINSTGQSATITASLKLTAFNLRDTSYVPTSTQLKSLKFALTESATSCTTNSIKSGTFSGVTFSNGVASKLPLTLFDLQITASANMSEAVTKTYYLWIWLDSSYSHTNVGNVNSDPLQGFSITAEWSGTIAQGESTSEAPVLDSGMIPVTLSSTGVVKTVSSASSSWYNYENKEWANVVLVDNDSRSTYQGTTGVTVNQDDILAYYVWIPRYKYRIPETQCSAIENINETEHSKCYKYILSSEEDKTSLINWWYDYLVAAEFTSFTLEQATSEVENGLQTGALSSSVVGMEIPMSEFIAVYNDETGSSITYTAEFVETNTISSVTEIDIEFESSLSVMETGDAVSTYRSHPAFWWDNDSDGRVDSGETVSGIWVGKFETSANTDSVCYTSNSTSNCVSSNVSPRIVPNVKSLRYQNVSNQFTTSQKFSISGNVYGLSNTSTNSHMMKNSEWGAVAYLSHSAYGINDEIRINNNSNFTTGCGASTENGSSTSSCQIGYNSSSTPQSTTGNITGVFDMSGGAWEYVMGVLADSSGNPRSGYDSSFNSGYNGLLYDGTSYTSGSSFPATKYYDLYTGSSALDSCNGGICYGHALSETANWYSDYALFVVSDYPWFMRGGYYIDGANAGAFASLSFYGIAFSNCSWRSVLVVGFGA